MSEEQGKLYYSIGEVAQQFGVNTSLLRYWEKEFPILKPRKNKKGDRFFTKKDVNNLHLIYHLVKERGYTLEGAKKKMKEDPDGIMEKDEMVKRLKKVKAFLLEIKEQLKN